MSINSHSESGKFFVMSLGHLHEEVVLGRYWMAQRQCYRGITKLLLSTPNDKELSISVPLVHDHTIAFSGVPDAQEYQGCKSKATTSTYVDKGKTNAEQSQQGTSKHQKAIWVPQKLIKAQEGQQLMWVPKNLCPAA